MNAADKAAEPVSRLGRRPFLKAVLWGGAGLVAIAGGTFAVLRRSPVDDEPVPDWVKNLTAGEYHLFNHLIPILIPTAGSTLTPVDKVPVLRNIDHMFGMIVPHVRKDLNKGLVLFDNAAVISGWHGKRVVDLKPEEAAAYFDAWSRGNSIQRALESTVKKFVYSSYWREPVTWQPVEFDGPVSDKWGIAYLGNAPLPAEDQPQQEGKA